MPAIVDKEICTACGACVEVCPVDAIVMKGKADINPETCIECGGTVNVIACVEAMKDVLTASSDIVIIIMYISDAEAVNSILNELDIS